MITSAAGSLHTVNTGTTTSAATASTEPPNEGMASDVSRVKQAGAFAAPTVGDWGWSEQGIRQGIDPETGDVHDGNGNIQPAGLGGNAPVPANIDEKQPWQNQVKRDAVASNFAGAGQSTFGVYGAGTLENLTFTSSGIGRPLGTDASSTVPPNVTLTVTGQANLTLTMSSQSLPVAAQSSQAYAATLNSKRNTPSDASNGS